MKIIKYRTEYWFVLLCAAGVLLNGIGLGQSISRGQWTAALFSLACSVYLIHLMAISLADSYVTTIGTPADVGPNMQATTLREES